MLSVIMEYIHGSERQHLRGEKERDKEIEWDVGVKTNTTRQVQLDLTLHSNRPGLSVSVFRGLPKPKLRVAI